MQRHLPPQTYARQARRPLIGQANEGFPFESTKVVIHAGTGPDADELSNLPQRGSVGTLLDGLPDEDQLSAGASSGSPPSSR